MDVLILGWKYFTKLRYVKYDKFASIDIFQNLFAIDHFYIVLGYVDSVSCKTDYKLLFTINIKYIWLFISLIDNIFKYIFQTRFLIAHIIGHFYCKLQNHG